MSTLAGRSITVSIIGTDNTITEESVLVQQIKVRDYDKAVKLIDKELELNALICGKTPEWIHSLAPESYEQIEAAAQELNAPGFFKYAQRYQERLTIKINSYKVEVMKAASERVLQAAAPGLLPR